MNTRLGSMAESYALGEYQKKPGDVRLRQLQERITVQIRRLLELDAECKQVAWTLGLADQQIVRRPRELGCTRGRLALLQIVPLVQIAWADGRVSQGERSLILEAARLHGVKEESPAFTKLLAWLAEPPPESFFATTLRVVAAMYESMPSDLRESRRQDLVSACTRVAEVSGAIIGFVGGGSRICDEERDLLRRVAAAIKQKTETETMGMVSITRVGRDDES